MAITKVYVYQGSHLSAYVYVKGRPVKVIFTCVGSEGKGMFTTNDPELMNAIERTSRFLSGEIYITRKYVDDVEVSLNVPEALDLETEPAVPEYEMPLDSKQDNPAKKIYPVELNTVQKAARALVQDYGVLTKDVETKAKLLAKADELNVEFPGIAK